MHSSLSVLHSWSGDLFKVAPSAPCRAPLSPAGCPDTPLSPERRGRCSSRPSAASLRGAADIHALAAQLIRISPRPALPTPAQPLSSSRLAVLTLPAEPEIRGIHLPGERTHLGDGCPQIRRQSDHQEPRSSAAHMGDFQTRK